MTKALCIHGHFYQPPRFDPWLEEVLPEGSAAPAHDWNARITRECYAPLAYARRLDGAGMISELVNCYAWMSFNFGPTLLRWMELHAPGAYARILDADRQSLRRLGHGNALAQVYHHPIMPLATDLDKDLEIGWAVQDFESRFGRKPEGMWLAETAVDEATLAALVRAGIRFTVLAPRQAKAVRPVGSGEFSPVTEDTLDTTRPYLVPLPQGKSMTVFFYHGSISRAVAFERLLENGEQFWARLSGPFPGGLRHIATDGESYGHHFLFGEMALAYVIEQAREGRDGMILTNYGAYLQANPARDEAQIHENSSWSCAHGLERWKTHCGCSNGSHPDWMQDWRRPLRRSLNYLKYYVDEHFFKRGSTLFHTPGLALAEYGLTLAGAETLDGFLDRHALPGLIPNQRQDACRLLLMQQLALASFASCAWFFDDIARIEPLNGLIFARRALDLLVATGGADVEAGFVRILSEAQSNMREEWDGAALWRDVVTPRRPRLADLAAYVLGPDAAPRGERHWPGLFLATDGRELVGRWHRTMDEERCPVPAQTSPCAGHLAEMALARSRRQEDALLGASCEAAEDLLPLLGDFTEGQTQPQAFLGLHMPGLVWNWLTVKRTLPRDMLGFIPVWLGRNPDIRALLERRLEAHGLNLARKLPATEKDLIDLIGNARKLGLGIPWWEIQNMVMEMPGRSRHEELCQLLGLATNGC